MKNNPRFSLNLITFKNSKLPLSEATIEAPLTKINLIKFFSIHATIISKKAIDVKNYFFQGVW